MGERVVAAARPSRDLGAGVIGEVTKIPFGLGHARGHGLDHVVRDSPAIGRLQIGEGFVRPARATHRTLAADRDTARIGRLLQDQHPRAFLGRLDRRHRAGEPVARDHDVEFLIERNLAHRSYCTARTRR